MLIEIDPAEVSIEPKFYDTGFNVLALWKGGRAGLAVCIWNDDNKTRLLFSSLEVYDETAVESKRHLMQERRATFRRLGIGGKLVSEVIRQAPAIGAREIFGNVVESDVERCDFDLLKWYARKGFEICDPIEGDSFPPHQVARIVMRFEFGANSPCSPT